MACLKMLINGKNSHQISPMFWCSFGLLFFLNIHLYIRLHLSFEQLNVLLPRSNAPRRDVLKEFSSFLWNRENQLNTHSQYYPCSWHGTDCLPLLVGGWHCFLSRSLQLPLSWGSLCRIPSPPAFEKSESETEFPITSHRSVLHMQLKMLCTYIG